MRALRTIVVGLGNPGPDYAATRHNIGFRVVDALAAARGLRWSRFPWLRVLARVAEDDALILAKPFTFMNRSGLAARALIRRYGVEPASVLAVYDDADLELGRLRVRKTGGSGVHNGMKSLAAELGTSDFPRIRLGVRGSGRSESDLADYLLSPFAETEQAAVDDLIAQAGQAVEAVVRHGVDRAMNQFNQTGTPSGGL
jgi:PTH1 family peptidyl-tRNA hydrolase